MKRMVLRGYGFNTDDERYTFPKDEAARERGLTPSPPLSGEYVAINLLF